MKQKIVRECAAFGRALVFWKTNSADIPAGSDGTKFVSKLGDDNTKLVAAGASQGGGTVTAQNALILALDKELETLVITAEAIAQDVPGFDDLFKRPKHLTPQDVMGTAEEYLQSLAAKPNEDAASVAAKAARVAQFVAHGQPATFVTDLQGKVNEIGTVKESHEKDREVGVLSTKAIAELARDGMKQIKHLDSLARAVYKNSPEKLRAWESASHVERASHHASTPAPAPTPPGTTAK